MNLLISFFIALQVVQAGELQTNSTFSSNAPHWITKGRVDKTTEHIQSFLEWDIHRITVEWYKDQMSFESAHHLGPHVLAVSKKNENKVLIGPKVTANNFDRIFGHELVHVIIFQKYKESVPQWLEEGLANFISKSGPVNYQWLGKQPFPKDIRDLVHPFSGDLDLLRYQYEGSQALAEMIASKCDLKNLLRLSVGRKMESYLDTYCRINDLNSAYRKWIKIKTPQPQK